MALAPFFPGYTDMDRAFDRAFSRALGAFPTFSSAPSTTTALDIFAPVTGALMAGEVAAPMDVLEHPNHYEVVVDAPGMGPDEVTVEVAEGVLTIAGKHMEKHEKRDQKGRVVRSERVSRQFRRSFALPETAMEEGIAADLDKGVLRVAIPKKPQAPKTQPKRITVGGGGNGAAAGTTHAPHVTHAGEGAAAAPTTGAAATTTTTGGASA